MSASLEQYYNIVFDQTFSPNTKHLATCDRYGRLAVFSLAAALNPSSAAGKSPTLTITAHCGPAYSLETAGNLLVSGGEDGIKAWKWSDVTKATNKGKEPVTVLCPPSRQRGGSDTNSLVYDATTQTLYSGCGDNNVYCWDIATGQVKATLSGHEDYVHCVCLCAGGRLVSGGEDGSVKLWDPLRQTKPVQTIKKGRRSEWVGCVGVDPEGEWVVCGGSQKPSIHHLATNSLTATLDTPPGVVTQAVLFVKDKLITAGSEPFLRHWTMSGEAVTAIPSTHTHTFSLAYNSGSHQYQMLTVTGDLSEVQVFTNLEYRAFSMLL